MANRQSQWNIATPDDLYDRLEKYLDEHKPINRSKLIRNLVEEFLDKESRKDQEASSNAYIEGWAQQSAFLGHLGEQWELEG